MVDYIADYWGSLRDGKTIPDVHTGYIRLQLPIDQPQGPESLETIFDESHSHSHSHCYTLFCFFYLYLITYTLLDGLLNRLN